MGNEVALTDEDVHAKGAECVQFANEIRGYSQEDRDRAILHLRIMSHGHEAPNDTKHKHSPAMATSVLEELDIDSTSPLSRDELAQVFKNAREVKS